MLSPATCPSGSMLPPRWTCRPMPPRRWMWRTGQRDVGPARTVRSPVPRTRGGGASCPTTLTAVAPSNRPAWASLVPRTRPAAVGTFAARQPSRTAAPARARWSASGPSPAPVIPSVLRARSVAPTPVCRADGSAPRDTCVPRLARPISIARQRRNAKSEDTVRQGPAPSVPPTCRARTGRAWCRRARQIWIARGAIASTGVAPVRWASAAWDAFEPGRSGVLCLATVPAPNSALQQERRVFHGRCRCRPVGERVARRRASHHGAVATLEIGFTSSSADIGALKSRLSSMSARRRAREFPPT